MPDEFGDNKLTQAEADELMSPLENDLTALFSYMRDDMLETLLDYEGTPEGFIEKILGPLQEEGGAVAKDMQNVNEGGKIMKTKTQTMKETTQLIKSLTTKILINKSINLCNQATENIYKALPVGTKRQRKDGVYQKQDNGKWRKITEGEKEKKETEDNKYKSPEMKEFANEIYTELGLNPENTFIHSTLIEGLGRLTEGNENPESYLSASTLEGSSKFLEKGDQTIFTVLESNDVKFREWGDVGWEGGSPRKTTYDESGLTDWDVKALVIPPEYKNNESAIALAILANDELENMGKDRLPIIGVDPEIKDIINNKIGGMYNQIVNDDYGGEEPMDSEGVEEIYEKIKSNFTF